MQWFVNKNDSKSNFQRYTLRARPAPNIPDGNANKETPIIIPKHDKNLPMGVIGVISPYPTVHSLIYKLMNLFSYSKLTLKL